LVTLPKNFWTRVLGSVIQLYAGEYTPSVDWALGFIKNLVDYYIIYDVLTKKKKKKNLQSPISLHNTVPS